MTWSDANPQSGTYDQHLLCSVCADHGATWSAPDTLSAGLGGASSYNDIAITGQRAFVVWNHQQSPWADKLLYGRRSLNAGDTWGPVVTLHTAGYTTEFTVPRCASTDRSVYVIGYWNSPGGDTYLKRGDDPSVTVSFPDTSAPRATSVRLPVRLSDTSGYGIVAAEVAVPFDGGLLTLSGVSTTGALAAGWSLESNLVAGAGGALDTLKLAMATDADTLAGAGALVYLDFGVADVRAPASSPLGLVHALFNDGMPVAVTTDGALRVTGTDGVLGASPAWTIPRWP
ncbi:MAG: hypothetical protein AB1505_24865 [Candidatus Latescibacterota bacterium]